MQDHSPAQHSTAQPGCSAKNKPVCMRADWWPDSIFYSKRELDNRQDSTDTVCRSDEQVAGWQRGEPVWILCWVTLRREPAPAHQQGGRRWSSGPAPGGQPAAQPAEQVLCPHDRYPRLPPGGSRPPSRPQRRRRFVRPFLLHSPHEGGERDCR